MVVDVWVGFVLLVINLVICEAKFTLDGVHHWLGVSFRYIYTTKCTQAPFEEASPNRIVLE